MDPVPGKTYRDGEVLRLDKDGCIVQWNAEHQCEYNSGETPEEFGLGNLTPEELQRIERG